MDKIMIYAILFVTVIFSSQVCEGTHYSPPALVRAVINTCCSAGKRDFVSHRKKRSLAFLKPTKSRSKRGLNAVCCGFYGCSSFEVVGHSNLSEECTNEGCYIEEIREVC